MITLTSQEAQQVLDALNTEGIGESSYRTAELLRAKIKRTEIWESRDLTKCECDHNEYCQHCYPVELREKT